MKEIQPDPANLCKRIDYTLPLIGFYSAPEPGAFEPLIRTEPGDCVFAFYGKWKEGKTLHITEDHSFSQESEKSQRFA